MDSPEQLPVRTVLPRPQRGGSVRVRVGTHELVLEAVCGGHLLLWYDGRESRRFALGLDRGGDLVLELRAPRLPLQVGVREAIHLVPGGRLRGYVQLPLVPTVVWRTSPDRADVVVELPPRDLAGEWDERTGTVLHCCSSLHVRFPMRCGEPVATLPLWLRNRSTNVSAAGKLPLPFATSDLRERRGALVLRPRRLEWDGVSWAAAAGARA